MSNIDCSPPLCATSNHLDFTAALRRLRKRMTQSQSYCGLSKLAWTHSGAGQAWTNQFTLRCNEEEDKGGGLFHLNVAGEVLENEPVHDEPEESDSNQGKDDRLTDWLTGWLVEWRVLEGTGALALALGGYLGLLDEALAWLSSISFDIQGETWKEWHSNIWN